MKSECTKKSLDIPLVKFDEYFITNYLRTEFNSCMACFRFSTSIASEK